MHPRPIGLTAIAIAAAAVAGCGGGSGGGAATDPVSQTKAQVEGICKRLNAEVAGRPFPVADFDPAKPSPADLPAVGEYFAPAVDAQQRALVALGALTPPAEIQTEVTALRNAVARLRTVVTAQVAAGRAADAKAFVATLGEVDATQAALKGAAKDLGVEDSCIFN